MEVVKYFFDDFEHFICLALVLWLIFPVYRTKCTCKHNAREVVHNPTRPKQSKATSARRPA